MATERNLCAGCLRDDEHSAAESWCVECQEEVCKTCSKTHKRLQPPHKVIPLSEAGAFSSGLIKTKCPDHPDRKVSFYCSCHDVIICDSCIADDHKNCQNVLPLDKAAKNVRGSFVFEDVQSRMRDLSKLLSKIKDIQARNFNELDLEQMEENAIRDISQMKESIVKNLDRVEKESTHKIRSDIKSFKEKAKELINEIGSHEKFVSEGINNVMVLDKSANEPQLFQAVKLMDKRTHEIESSVRSRLSKMSQIEFQLNKKADNFATGLDFFGQIAVTEKEIDLPKLKQVQVPITSSDDSKFRLLHMFPTSDLNPEIRIMRGCIADDKLLLPSEKDFSLYVCNHDGSDVKRIDLGNKPRDVSAVDKNRAIVTLWSKGHCTLNTKSFTLSNIKQPYGYALSYDNGQIYVDHGNKSVKVLNDNGDTLNEFKTMKDADFIHYSSNGNFYYTTVNDDEIYQVTSSGERTFFKHPEMSKPRGITSDKSGNLYVVCGHSDNVFKISENDKTHKIVLNKDDGVRYANGLYFDINLVRRLLILNDNGEEVLVFQID